MCGSYGGARAASLAGELQARQAEVAGLHQRLAEAHAAAGRAAGSATQFRLAAMHAEQVPGIWPRLHACTLRLGTFFSQPYKLGFGCPKWGSSKTC